MIKLGKYKNLDLEKIRKEKGYTQQMMADEMCITKVYYIKMIRGETPGLVPKLRYIYLMWIAGEIDDKDYMKYTSTLLDQNLREKLYKDEETKEDELC